MEMHLLYVAPKFSANIQTDRDAVRRAIEHAREITDGVLRLDEIWPALYFVLTGKFPITKNEAVRLRLTWDDNSLDNVIMGGEPTPYKGLHENARYLGPDQVKRYAQKLSRIDPNELTKNADLNELVENNLLSSGYDYNQATIRKQLADQFTKLVKFYTTAAKNKDGMLIYLS